MLLVLMGKTASGKTTIKNILQNEYGWEPVITYTTRPPRRGEKDGVDYHFITEKEFFAMEALGMFFETIEYPSDEGLVYYGTPYKDLKESNMDRVIILDPIGAKVVFDDPDIDQWTVYLDPPEDVRSQRALNRGDKVNELNRRQVKESRIFIDMEMQDIWDLRLSEEMRPEDLADLIDSQVTEVYYGKKI